MKHIRFCYSFEEMNNVNFLLADLYTFVIQFNVINTAKIAFKFKFTLFKKRFIINMT